MGEVEATWTSEPPTVPGQYWVRGSECNTCVVRVERSASGGMRVSWPGTGFAQTISQVPGCEWYGPLVAP